MLPPPDVAQQHADSRLVLVDAAALAAADAWAQVDPDDIVGSWTQQVPGLLAVTSGAQLAAATDADGYVDDVVEASDLPAEDSPRIDPAAFVGGSSGMQLVTMLIQPVFTALMAIAAKSSPHDALRLGGQQLGTTVRTQVADAGRIADGVSLVAHKAVDGYVRTVVGKTCSRCVVLAGKHYRWNAGFQRHPHCDCVHLPCQIADAGKLVQDPHKLYQALTDRQRTAAGWSQADQRALADGADIFQVTNARRGVYTAGGRRFTREGVTKRGLPGSRLGARKGKRVARLTPEQIYREAGENRDEALRLLYNHGYLVNEPAVIKRADLGLAASKSSGISPAKAAASAGPPIRRVLEIQRTTDDVTVAFEFEAKRITGREIKADFSGASPATAREHAEGVLRGLERFPDAQLRRIDHFDRAEQTYAEAGGGEIQFNLRFADVQGRRRYLTALQGDVTGWEKDHPFIYGWHVRGSNSPAAIAVHEFGHVIDIDTLGDAIHGGVENLVRALAERENIRPDWLIGRQISQYAQTNTHELIAEAFTDVLINGERASELSRGIFDLLEAEYSRGGGVVRRPAMAAAKAVSKAEGLAGKTVAQLRALAKERGIKVPSRALKADIVALLEEPKVLTGAAKRAAARVRQAEIERRGQVADLLAEMDELIAKGAEAAVFAQRLELAVANGVDAAMAATLRRAVAAGDTTKLRAAMTRAGNKYGLKATGRAGQKVKFDEALHESVGEMPKPGAQVVVVRRGTTLDLNGEKIELSKAKVSNVVTPKAAKLPEPPGKGPLPNRDQPSLATLFKGTKADLAKIEKGINGTYAGLRVKAYASPGIGGDSLRIYGEIWSPDGRQVGNFSRTLRRSDRDGMWAYHELLELDNAHQGSGFAYEFNRNLIDWYRRSGFDRVTTHANIDVGGYAWASRGFDFTSADEANPLFEKLSGLADQLRERLANDEQDSPDLADQLETMQGVLERWKSLGFGSPGYPSAYELSQVGRKRGMGLDDMWPGKRLMLGSSWHGVLRL